MNLRLILPTALCVGLFFSACASRYAGPIRTPEGDYRWQSRRMILVVSPQKGGKITSFQYRGKEMLATAAADSLAFGSTLWPAPHIWGWPPPPDFDRLPHTAIVAGDTLVVRSPEISPSGWRFEKRIWVSDRSAEVMLRYRITNVTDSARKVAAWEVSRFPKGGQVFAFPDTSQKSFKLFKNLPNQWLDSGIYIMEAPAGYQGSSQKISFKGRYPWLAYWNDGLLFEKWSKGVTWSEIAPGAGELEIYIDNDSDYLELEIQGAYRLVGPGESAVLDTEWRLSSLKKISCKVILRRAVPE